MVTGEEGTAATGRPGPETMAGGQSRMPWSWCFGIILALWVLENMACLLEKLGSKLSQVSRLLAQSVQNTEGHEGAGGA